MVSASKDDKLVSIRATFGMWGIGCYWTIVELVAEQITEKSDRAEATLIVSELLGLFGCKRDKLKTFLEHSSNISLMKHTLTGNIVKIDIPKILEFADNYIKYNGKSLKTLQRQNEVSSKQEENRTEEKRIENKELIYDSIHNRWNDFAKQNNLSQIITLSKKRESSVSTRMGEKEFDFEKILAEIKQSDFLKGSTGWKVDFDFVFCSANNYLKILEGKYRNGKNTNAVKKSDQTARATFRHTEEQLRENKELTESIGLLYTKRD